VELVITRVLDAPRALVWKAWTDPKQVTKWWGPDGFTTTTREIAVRPGGMWRFVMHGPDGRDYENRIEFTEVVEPERLAYRHAGEGDTADIAFEATVTFDEENGKTRLELRSTFASAPERRRVLEEFGALEGGLQHVARLAAHVSASTGRGPHALTVALPSEREIVLRRVFDAPRSLVFEAFSRPEHIRRWWGSADFEMVVCDMDFRPGGAWRFVQRAPDGTEHPFRGVYKEIVRPSRIVQTFIYDVDGIRDFPAVETMLLEERGNQAVLTVNVLHASQEARDGQLGAGMESGAAESMDRLEALVESLARGFAAASGAAR
jgi:uncharacterized protein YndB with AHSA1/START domain